MKRANANLLLILGVVTSAAFADTNLAGTQSQGVSDDQAANAKIIFDYQDVEVLGDQDMDLVGFHVLKKVGDWTYLGIGGYAPHLEGEYGGFMAFDFTAAAEFPLTEQLFASGMFSIGGGGGGKENTLAATSGLSGTGQFTKTALGLGYDFDSYSIGARISRLQFKNSQIDSNGLNIFLEVPFNVALGNYSESGRPSSTVFTQPESVLSYSFDNYHQIDPQGTNRSEIRLADLQYSQYFSENDYWFGSLGVGYAGMPLYNQVLAGLGHRYRISPDISLSTQIGFGSGGYAPDVIDTNSGLLVYPKVIAEYKLTDKFGVAFSAGYMTAPKGTSSNISYGLSLNYHIGDKPPSDTDLRSSLMRGQRISLVTERASNITVANRIVQSVPLQGIQVDTLITDRLYIPLKAVISIDSYAGYPGYGELLAGVGISSRYDTSNRFQVFAQLLGGVNAHGLISRPELGVDFGLSENLALRATLGKAFGIDRAALNYTADYVGLGLTYRFSAPSK